MYLLYKHHGPLNDFPHIFTHLKLCIAAATYLKTAGRGKRHSFLFGENYISYLFFSISHNKLYSSISLRCLSENRRVTFIKMT